MMVARPRQGEYWQNVFTLYAEYAHSFFSGGAPAGPL
jgi:hypothetical protein